MNIRITNNQLGYARLTTDHAASSYGIPVLVIDSGLRVADAAQGPFGPADTVLVPAELAWTATGQTYADAVVAGMEYPSAQQIEAINAWMAPIYRLYC
jgi:hypothetical protein